MFVSFDSYGGNWVTAHNTLPRVMDGANELIQSVRGQNIPNKVEAQGRTFPGQQEAAGDDAGSSKIQQSDL